MSKDRIEVPSIESFIRDMSPYAGKYKAIPSLLEPNDSAVRVTRNKLADCRLADRNPPIVSNKSNSNPSQHIKMSVRLPKGIVTSLTIKKNIIALWLLYTCDPEALSTEIIDSSEANNILCPEDIKKDEETISKSVSSFIYKCLEKWENETGKGLSDFITEMMIEDLLEDYVLYENLLPLIKG